MNKKIKFLMLSLSLSSCSGGYEHKFISTSFTDLCLSEDKNKCIEAIDEKCKSNYIIDSMQKYEYYIDSDKIMIEFKCKENYG